MHFFLSNDSGIIQKITFRRYESLKKLYFFVKSHEFQKLKNAKHTEMYDVEQSLQLTFHLLAACT
jgi:hypothetical protein